MFSLIGRPTRRVVEESIFLRAGRSPSHRTVNCAFLSLRRTFVSCVYLTSEIAV